MVHDRGRIPSAGRSTHDGTIVPRVSTPPPEPPEPNFSHLISMTDERGTFEHALFSEPRPEHGFCTDDMARVLVVATREPKPASAVRGLALLSSRFLQGALDEQGKCRNRMDRYGSWEDDPALEDCWGRSIWGLGTALSCSDDHIVRELARNGLERAMTQRSLWPRAMAFAALVPRMCSTRTQTSPLPALCCPTLPTR